MASLCVAAPPPGSVVCANAPSHAISASADTATERQIRPVIFPSLLISESRREIVQPHGAERCQRVRPRSLPRLLVHVPRHSPASVPDDRDSTAKRPRRGFSKVTKRRYKVNIYMIYNQIGRAHV